MRRCEVQVEDVCCTYSYDYSKYNPADFTTNIDMSTRETRACGDRAFVADASSESASSGLRGGCA